MVSRAVAGLLVALSLVAAWHRPEARLPVEALVVARAVSVVVTRAASVVVTRAASLVAVRRVATQVEPPAEAEPAAER